MNNGKVLQQCEQDRENEETRDWYCEECKKKGNECVCDLMDLDKK